MEHVVMFKRGVYARALGHLAPMARVVAGAQAVPQQRLERRPGEGQARNSQRPRARAGRRREGSGPATPAN
jgi:putative (di)nucleoside polyphosphate hydrolase